MGANAEQAEFWSGDPGRKWVAHQPLLDHLFSEATAALFEAAEIGPGARVLDIGCGAGDTTLEAARRAGATGRALGIDVSAPLLALAEERARDVPNAAFLKADAQSHGFGAGGFDRLTSRFGVMFFDDFDAAFGNLRRALAPGGRAALLAWAPQGENPWSQIPRDAGVARLGPPSPTPPGAPGQFAFADPVPVAERLRGAGFAEVEAGFLDIHLRIDGGAREAAVLATMVGPISRIMAEHDGTEEDRAAIVADVAERFRAFETADGVRVPARLTRFTARVP
ncbi:class I SAM-dependent methyltransferase [Ovoidimarina sediminis]|uniref:class I SAM-dependent methyltransferase n=1 Tax=Ovoidimarina sediminis TaxID=3079856 RepID=UPI002913400E|nr:methyltransferase domain-containing protein [Rhodophyticola sp. MJ-SS7]MDU8945669.1 methyltransferase domain-containing protein [Rhodophyticola sp. MJ-SS7]